MSKRKYLIQGKTMLEWAKHFGVTKAAVYLMHYRGNLEAKINGTYQRKYNPKKIYEGKTLDEWSEILGVGYHTVQKHAKQKLLTKIQSGEHPIGNCKHLVRGKTLKYWGDKLGISRERARQLDECGYLEARIDGAGPRSADRSKYMLAKKAQREKAVQQYIPGEKVSDFSKRIGVRYQLALKWLRQSGVRFQSQTERMKDQGYKGKVKDEKLRCGVCKHFSGDKHYRCVLGSFALTKKWGGCKRHESV